MLDVHAPEHRLTGARDFFLHLFTITCGLLIALALEDAATALHHRADRREAETKIRQELERNRNTLKQGGPVVLVERDNLLHVIQMLEAASQSKLPQHESMTLNYSDASLDDAAWRTANGTGVLSYMEYDEAEHFADAYKEQAQLEDAEIKTLDDFVLLVADVGPKKDLTPEEAKLALPDARRAFAHINGILAIGQGTLDSYNKALR